MGPDGRVGVEPVWIGGASNQPLAQLAPALVISMRLPDFRDELPGAPDHEILRVRLDAQPADLIEGVLHEAYLGDRVSRALGRHRTTVYHQVQHRRRCSLKPSSPR